MKQQTVIAISGVKNSGKTTLIQHILPKLESEGLNVAVIKHDGHTFQADPVDTDTGKYMEAGAYGTAIFDGEKYKIIKRGTIDEQDLIQQFPEADVLLLEGLKYSTWPKIEIIRAGNSAQLVCSSDTLLALVTDVPNIQSTVPIVSIDDIDGVAEIILQHMVNTPTTKKNNPDTP